MSAPLTLGQRAAKAMLLAPLSLYRLAISPLLGVNCRHMPTCSDYAREAIETNGAWKGGWLALSRICRCRPFGSHGFDPVPDLTDVHHPYAPWRYGRWTGPRDSGVKPG
jgi:uncharacterized protein